MGQGIAGGGLAALSGSYVTNASGIAETTTEWTVHWYLIGKLLSIEIAGQFPTRTSNATSFTFTDPAPSIIRPKNTAPAPAPAGTLTNNSVVEAGLQAVMELDGTITWLRNGNSSGWTAALQKGFGGSIFPNFTIFLRD